MTSKAMAKILARKVILRELRLHFKRKNNNIEKKKILALANFYGKTLERRVSCFCLESKAI